MQKVLSIYRRKQLRENWKEAESKNNERQRFTFAAINKSTGGARYGNV